MAPRHTLWYKLPADDLSLLLLSQISSLNCGPITNTAVTLALPASFRMDEEKVGSSELAVAELSDTQEVSPNDEEYSTRDGQEMAYFGKKQQLWRNFGFFSIAGFVCSLLSTWEGMFA